MSEINKNTIWSSRQNHPELVVQDIKEMFSLNEEQCKQIRLILMNRGINKWLYARRLFIKLKHEVKEIRKKSISDYGQKHPLVKEIKKIQEKMQNIAKMPRWIEWGTYVHKNMKQNIKDIKIKGKHC